MKVQEIKEIAQKLEIPVKKLTKPELIRAIQRHEGNDDCFASGQSAGCGQQECLWRGDCN